LDALESPISGDSFLFFQAESAITVTGIDCLVNAATSAQITVKECDANGASCTNTEATMTCGTTNTTESGAIDDPSVAASAWMRIVIGTVSGTPGHVTICMTVTF
jgi:hypothetical protein